ncbi:MAG: hypothetical protein ACYCPN_00010 [Thermoplasmata archaeon]
MIDPASISLSRIFAFKRFPSSMTRPVDGAWTGGARDDLREFFLSVPVAHPLTELLGESEDIRLEDLPTVKANVTPEGREPLSGVGVQNPPGLQRDGPEPCPQLAFLATGPLVAPVLDRVIPRAAELITEFPIPGLEEGHQILLPRTLLVKALGQGRYRYRFVPDCVPLKLTLGHLFFLQGCRHTPRGETAQESAHFATP